MIQFLDKLSLNYASAYTLIDDLDLSGQRYSWVAAIFNFGYLFWAIPANLLVQQLPVAKYTGTMLLVWALILCCHVAARNYAGMLALRFVLGMFEASISPAIMNICSMFYTRSEQPLRMCIFLSFNGMATMVGALIGYGLGHATNTSLKSWQLIFLVIGLLNFVWAFVFLLTMPDSPSNAKFLTHKEKIAAISRVSENMIGVKTPAFKMHQALEALTDFKVLCCALIGLACGVVNGGVSNFASALIKVCLIIDYDSIVANKSSRALALPVLMPPFFSFPPVLSSSSSFPSAAFSRLMSRTLDALCLHSFAYHHLPRSSVSASRALSISGH